MSAKKECSTERGGPWIGYTIALVALVCVMFVVSENSKHAQQAREAQARADLFQSRRVFCAAAGGFYLSDKPGYPPVCIAQTSTLPVSDK